MAAALALAPVAGSAADPGAASLDRAVSFSAPSGLFAGTLALTLSGADPGQVIRYTLTPPSAAGAGAPEPTALSDEYAAPLVLNAPAIVRAAVFSADGLARGPVATAQFVRYADTGADALTTFSSQLPLLVIDSHGLGPMVRDGIDRPAWIYGFVPAAGGAATLTATPAFATPLEFAVRGMSSAHFPKQSYKLKLLGADGKKQALAPFGLGRFDKWQLIGPWGFDRTFLRNAYVYELSNRIGFWAPRTRFVEVFVNRDDDGLTAADHAGVYALTDKIEPHAGRLAIADLDEDDIAEPKVSGGYIFKIDWPDPEDYAWTTGGEITLILDTPDIDDIVPEQALYLEKYVQQFEDALFADTAAHWTTRNYLNYINRDTWIDFHLLTTLTKNGDAFAGSAFFNKDRNGRISAGPLWDFDRSMGSTDPRQDAWDEWRSTQDGGDGWNHNWWGRLVRDPDFMQGWIDRWQSLRRDQFADAALAGLADELSAQIGPAAAERDVATFPGNTSRFANGYQGEIDHLKTWLQRRAQWIDRQFTAPPTIATQGNQVTITPPPGAALVYTLDGSDPRVSSGALSHAARQTADPLVLAADATFSVRAHALGAVSFPATPWSSRHTVIGTAPPPPLPAVSPATVATGHTTTFSAGNFSGNIQWQVSTDSGKTWSNLTDNAQYRGTTTATLTVTAEAALNGAHYRFSTTHLGTAYFSNAASLAVMPVFFPFPTGIASDASGNLFVADAKSDAVGHVNATREVRTLAGGASPSVLNRPEGLALLPDGSVAVADTANDIIRRVTPTGATTVLAGRAGVRGHADGPAGSATFSSPRNVAVDASGTLYVADAMNHVIRRITPGGTVSTFAGVPGASGSNDGARDKARFHLPSAVAVGSDGSVFVADTTNHTVRRISATGEVTTLAGLGGVSGFDDGTGDRALFNRPGGLAVDHAGNLFVADTGNSTIRKVSAAGAVTTFAGVPGVSGVANGTGSDALFNQPQDLALDGAGNLYVADTGNALLRRITPAREVSILTLSAAPPVENPNPNPNPPTNPPPPPPPGVPLDNGNSTGSSGGGGAPSTWFLSGLGVLALVRLIQRRRGALS